MRARVTNLTSAALQLPWPYSAVVGALDAAVIADTPENVTALLGGDSSTNVWRVEPVHDSVPPTVSASSGDVTAAHIAASSIDGAKAAPTADLATVGGVAVVFVFPIPDAASADYDIVLAHAIEVVDIVVRKEGGAGGAANTVQVKSTGNAISDVMDINVADQTQVRALTIDDARAAIAAAGILRVSAIKAGGNAACKVFVHAIKR